VQELFLPLLELDWLSEAATSQRSGMTVLHHCQQNIMGD